MSGTSGWSPLWKVNGAFLRALICFGLAWLFRQMAVPGFEMFALFAAIFALGGVKCLGEALFGAVKLLLSMRKWARYRAKGGAPKADKMADAKALRDAGLLK